MAPKRKQPSQLEVPVRPASSPGPAFRFLDLPLELRTVIYELAITSDLGHESNDRHPISIDLYNVKPPVLAHVSSQIRVEAPATFFSRMMFYTWIWPQFSAALTLKENTKAWLESAAVMPYVAQLRTIIISLASYTGRKAHIVVRINGDNPLTIERDSLWAKSKVAVEEDEKLISTLPRIFEMDTRDKRKGLSAVAAVLNGLGAHLLQTTVRDQCTVSRKKVRLERLRLSQGHATRNVRSRITISSLGVS